MLTKIKLFGHVYAIEYDKNWHDESACAKLEANKLLIRIDATMPESRQEEALLHEVFEAMNYHLELALDHNKLCGMSEVLYGIIKENGLFK